MLAVEFREILPVHTTDDLFVDLNGDAFAVAFADAECAHQDDVIFQLIGSEVFTQKLDDLRRTLQVAGGTDTTKNTFVLKRVD